MTIEAMKQALEALEILARYENPETKIQVRKPKDGGPIVTMYPHKVASDAAQSLRQAIEQAEKQEPVAHVVVVGDMVSVTTGGAGLKDLLALGNDAPLYTTPQPQREWVGLTRREFAEILCDDRWQGRPELMLLQVQQQLKEKNT